MARGFPPIRSVLLSAAFTFAIGVPSYAQTPDDIQGTLDEAYERYRTLAEGKRADHNPAVRKADPNLFGIALVTVDGAIYTAGDTVSELSMASISKVFTMAHVFQESGPEAVRTSIGVDATGQRYNSFVAIEQHEGNEMNPLVNAGAIATTSMVRGETREEIWSNLLNRFSDFAGRQLSMNVEVYRADSATNQGNQATAMLMYAYGQIRGDPLQACDLYTRHCAISVNVRDLAVMAGTLANFGRNPMTGKQVIDAEHVPEALAVMATAGMYDDAGQWLFETGLPAKSGVSGGIIAISPGKFGVAAISPPLDEAGNSVRGQKAISDISNALGGNPYAPKER